MPKNNSQTSPLDKIAEQMEQEQAAEQTSSQQEATTETPAETQDETAEKYVPRDDEKGFYHVRLEKERYDQRTGKKLSKPFIQKYSEKEYKKLTAKKDEKDRSIAEMLGYTKVEVLWNPKENI